MRQRRVVLMRLNEPRSFVSQGATIAVMFGMSARVLGAAAPIHHIEPWGRALPRALSLLVLAIVSRRRAVFILTKGLLGAVGMDAQFLILVLLGCAAA